MERCFEPAEVTQGERVAWRRSYAEYPASAWSLEYRFRGDGPGANVTATADGDEFTAVLTKEATGDLAPVRYTWQAWVTETADPTNTFLMATGATTVKLGFPTDATEAVDTRSRAERTLDAIDAVLENRATTDQAETEIGTPAGNTKIKRLSRRELLDQRNYFARLVRLERERERMRRGGRPGPTVLVRLREK